MISQHVVFAGVMLAQPLAPPDQYVSLGAIAGVDTEGLFVEPQLELGRRLAGSLWAHAIAFGGDNDDTLWSDPPTEDRRLEFGGGLELRPCYMRDSICMDHGGPVDGIAGVLGCAYTW